MKRYFPYAAAASLAFALGVSLDALAAVVEARVPLRLVATEDFSAVILSFAGSVACYVLAATGWRGQRPDLLYCGLFFSLGSVLAAFCLLRLAVIFVFEGM